MLFRSLAGFAAAVMGVPMPTITDLGLAKGLVETSAYIFSLGGLGYGLAWGSVHSMGYRSFFMGLLGAGCFGVAAIGYALVEPLWIDHNADLIHLQLSSKFFLQGAIGGTLLGLAAGVHLHRSQSPQQ